MQTVVTNAAAAACDRRKKVFLDEPENVFEDEAGVDGAGGKRSPLEDLDDVPPCPKCGAAMEPVRHEDEIIFFGCTRFKETGCRGKWFKDRTSKEEKLYLKSCPECHQGLKRGFGRNRQPYCACFEAEDHECKAPLFFTHDGRPKPRLVPKGEFHCPECEERLSYFQVQNGLYRGRKTFACFNADKHASKRALYWDDRGGKPAW